jgi:hypothetical protein
MSDVKTIIAFLDRYGHSNYDVQLYDDSCTEPASKVISFTLEMFYDQDTTRFANHIRQILKHEAEEALRARNPTLQRAYDEYQLLLKLSK